MYTYTYTYTYVHLLLNMCIHEYFPNRVLSSDSFHWKYYTPEIHQIDKLKFLGTNSNSAKMLI